MKPIRLHLRVYDDIDEALARTLAEFGPRQIPVYERLIVEGRLTIRRHPTIGRLHAPHRERGSRLGVGLGSNALAQIARPHHIEE